jgi:4-aminobutyrate aminotransferase/(S)-3-amino-2-methylpropionate transaminase
MIGVLGSTFSANPLACAAAGAAIDVIQDEALVDRALGLEQVFARRYDAFSDLSNVVDFRGAGAAWALELKPSEDDGGGRLANAVARTMLESHGVLTITTGSPAGNVVALCPPAVLPPEVLENVLDQLLDAVASVEV